jgi:hypothetical protein
VRGGGSKGSRDRDAFATLPSTSRAQARAAFSRCRACREPDARRACALRPRRAQQQETHEMNMIQKSVAAIAAAACLTATSCIGPNNAYGSVHAWNSRLSDSKYLNELAFLGLHIVPVYPLALFGDYLVFNSVEFWTGDNWISKPEAFKPQEGK